MPELAQAEKNIFGEDAKYHPVTMMPLEQGRGALPPDQQALIHCMEIERRHGKHVADAMRRKLADAAAFAKAEKAIAADGVTPSAAKGA